MHNGGVPTANAASAEPPRAEFGRPGPMARVLRAGTSSALATGISQLTFIGLSVWGATPALTSALAFLAGAVPNFLLARRWAWGRSGTPALRRELVPYVAVITATGLTAVGLTTLTGHLIEPLALSGFWRVVVLDVVFLGSYGLVFMLKFVLLDRLVFRDAGRTPGSTS